MPGPAQSRDIRQRRSEEDEGLTAGELKQGLPVHPLASSSLGDDKKRYEEEYEADTQQPGGYMPDEDENDEDEEADKPVYVTQEYLAGLAELKQELPLKSLASSQRDDEGNPFEEAEEQDPQTEQAAANKKAELAVVILAKRRIRSGLYVVQFRNL